MRRHESHSVVLYVLPKPQVVVEEMLVVVLPVCDIIKRHHHLIQHHHQQQQPVVETDPLQLHPHPLAVARKVVKVPVREGGATVAAVPPG